MHLRIAKQVVCYFKGTITLEIVWKNDPIGHQFEDKYGSLGVVSYINSNYADDLKDRKSIIRYNFFISRAIVTQYKKR